jgi:hypothetical protein
VSALIVQPPSMPYHYDLVPNQRINLASARWRRPAYCPQWLLSILVGIVILSSDVLAAAPTVSNIERRSATQTSIMPDWEKVRAAAASLMDKPTAGTDPLVYFVDPLGRQLGLPDAASTLAAKKLPPPLATELKVTELAETARHLIRALAAWNLAKTAQDLAWVTDEADFVQLARRIPEQAAWLSEDTDVSSSRFIMASIPALKPNGAEASPIDEAAYRDYAAVLDAKYPVVPGNHDSWFAILEKNGIQAWHDRLAGTDPGRAGAQDMQALAERYIASRLRPVLRLRLAQQGSALESRAVQRVYQDWLNLYGWKDAVRLRRGLARLCGSWQWTIHNHQNHGEQKLMVNFSSSVPGPDQGGPAEIVVLGDLVYLRWEAAGRVQEDSLLFSKEGQRLEGTFINNVGGWGSVTGKRTAGCSKK